MPAVSAAQERLMQAAAHTKGGYGGVPQSVGKEFVGDAAAPQAAGVVFVAPDGDVLLLLRTPTEPNYGGHWALPGGKADDGETPEQAATRESQEEIGVEPSTLKMLDQVNTPNGMVFTTFAAPVDQKFVPTLNDEHSGYAWVGLDRLPAPIHPQVQRVLGEHIGAAEDMTPADWDGLRSGFAKWTREEEAEPAHASDAIAMDEASVRTLDDAGRLHVASAHISKAGINGYLGKEIPHWEELRLDPKRLYKMLRDPTELAKAAPTFNGIQLLIKHEPVHADDHQPDLVVGTTGTNAVWNDPYLDNELVIWAREGIDAVLSNRQKELSSGYPYTPDMTPGTFQGEPYDGVMRDIVGNHVALVRKGRAGPDVVVGDSADEIDWHILENALRSM